MCFYSTFILLISPINLAQYNRVFRAMPTSTPSVFLVSSSSHKKHLEGDSHLSYSSLLSFPSLVLLNVLFPYCWFTYALHTLHHNTSCCLFNAFDVNHKRTDEMHIFFVSFKKISSTILHEKCTYFRTTISSSRPFSLLKL